VAEVTDGEAKRRDDPFPFPGQHRLDHQSG
jgi:hypothetical protein